MDKYSAYIVEKSKSRARVLQLSRRNFQELKKFKELYENPLFNAAMTFIEPFSRWHRRHVAAILRKKPECNRHNRRTRNLS